MKAIVQDTYGSTDVLELRDIDRPQVAADDEALIRVHAAGVDPAVWHLMTGLPYPVRLAGYGLRAPKTPVPGMDVAGVVESVGKDVTRFHIEPGHTVLIVGASGGVGSYATQIAKAFGAHVTGVCGTTKVDLVRSLGADHVIDYTHYDFADGKQGYDVILDIGGNSALTRLRHALSPRGTLVIVGGEGGGRLLGGLNRQLWATMLSPFVSQTLRVVLPNENHKDMSDLAELMQAGRVMPSIDRVYPLSEAAKAIRYVRDGNARGKVVIAV